jgi:hypothetical protein
MFDTKTGLKVKFLIGSISIPTLDKLILVNFPLLPDENTADEAKQLPTSFSS